MLKQQFLIRPLFSYNKLGEKSMCPDSGFYVFKALISKLIERLFFFFFSDFRRLTDYDGAVDAL